MRRLLLAIALTALACGGHPPIPTRGVVESDLGSWKFRRFQGPLLDDRYPSQLPGGALEGALPPGPDEAPQKSRTGKPEYDANNPRPDIDHYDPARVELPAHEDGAKPTGDAARPKNPRRSK